VAAGGTIGVYNMRSGFCAAAPRQFNYKRFEVVRGRGLTIGKAKPLYSSCSQFGIIVHTVVLRPYRPLAAHGPGSNPP